MPLRDTTIARLGLVALAIALWKNAAGLVFDGLLPRYPEAVALLTLTYVASFVALLFAASSAKVTKVAGSAILALAIATAVVMFRDGVRRASSESLPSTDAHVFMDVAARYFLHGKNPYVEGLAEAFRVYRMPLAYATPLLDGDFTDRQSYPSLSFLVLVPAVLAHVPTYLVYTAAFLVALGVVVQKAPWWARPIIVALFTLDESYLGFAVGGVTDTVWVMFVVLAIVWWRSRPTLAAVLIGLACAYKQHPWFIVPLLLVRIAHEHGEPPWGRACRRFLAIVAGVFLATNLPFVLWGPRAWFTGVTEPLAAPMIQLSEGLTAFSMTGVISMPRAGSSIIFWSVYALALFAYARHTRVLRDWCWVVPGVVLWFGYRALMSYWYFFALTAVAALVTGAAFTGDDDAGDVDPMRERSWRPTAMAAAATAIGIAAFLVWCSLRPAPFGITLLGPIEAWDRRAFLLRVRVENRLDRALIPQFRVQSYGLQPLPWIIELGPAEIPPGKSEDYVIRGASGFTEFEVANGARLTVQDRRDPGRRAFLSVPAERSIILPDAVPNPEFRVVETRTQVPTGWTFESTDGDAKLTVAKTLDARARVTFDFAAQSAPVQPTSALAACVARQHLGELSGSRRALMSTILPLPEGTLTMNVNVPASANRAPYDELYGFALSLRDFRAVVLLGDDVPRGILPSGEIFTSLPVTRGAWATVRLSPRAILERLQAPLRQVRHHYVRVVTLDLPTIPVELGLMVTAPAGKRVTAEFGRIEQADLRPSQELFAHPSPAGFAAWRAELDIDNRNFIKAAERLEIANAVEPTPERLVRLGDAYLLGADFAHARDAYARVLASGSVPDAEQGLGLALIELGDLAGATQHLERSRDAYKEIEKSSPRWRYLKTLGGLVRVSVRQNDCETARRLRDEIVAETPTLQPPSLAPCPE